MATYYDKFSGVNCGAALWVGDRTIAQNGVTVPWEGGWHSYAGSWYVNGIYNSIGRDAGAGELRRDYTESGSVSGSSDVWWTSYTETFPRYNYDYDVTLYSYVRASVNGATREAQAEYTFTVPHIPDAPTDFSASYVSDNRIDLAWTNPAQSYEAMCIEVSIDGGAFSECAVIWNTSPTSYSYTQATAGHSYQFRIRAYYMRGYSAYASYGTAIYTTPTAPTAISAQAAQGTSVTINVTNAMQSPYKLQYAVSTDDGANWGDPQDSASLTSFSVSISGVGRVRVRNVYDGVTPAFASSWLVSDRIITSAQPNAPTIVSPSDGGKVDIADGSVTLTWMHNPVDGSAQSRAELFYESEGGATDTIDITGDAQSYTLEFGSGFTVGDLVNWKVRTWGSFENPSPWSEVDFTLYSAPTASMTFPGTETREGSIYVVGMPIELDASYSDMAGLECVYAQVILSQNGRTIRTSDTDDGEVRIVGSAGQQRIQATLTIDEFLPANGESYTIVLNVRSSSGLQSTSNAVLNIDFIEPQAGELSIVNDPETGYASLLATFDNSASEQTYSGATNTQYESTEGYVRSLTVEGKSEKWNQRVHERARTWTNNGITFTVTADNKVTANGTATGSAYVNCTVTATGINGHKMLLIGCPSGGSNSTYFLKDGYENAATARDYGDGVIITKTTNNTVAQVIISQGVTVTNKVFQPCYIDLTAIFGAGNEPTTLDDPRIAFLKAYALAHPAYDAGSLISIESVGVQSNGTTTTIPATLRSAGSVHDTLMADADSWTVGRKIGVVDLGTLMWDYDREAGHQRFYTVDGVTGIKETTSDSDIMNIMTARFTTTDFNTVFNNTADKSIAVRGDNVQVYDSSYIDPTAFKNSMSGVYLFYELQTPTQDPETSMDTIEIGSAFTVATDLDSAFELTTWDGSADAESISVSRVNADGTITPLLTDGSSGSGIVDKYVPLNTPYQYAVTTKAASKAVKTVYVANRIDSLYWFAYWTHKDGDTVTEMMAKAKWNPSGSVAISRPEKRRVHYVGREYPVSYDSKAIDQVNAVKFAYLDNVDDFVRLMHDGGRGIYKGCDGWVFHADFDFGESADYTSITRMGELSLTVYRIEGAKL